MLIELLPAQKERIPCQASLPWGSSFEQPFLVDALEQTHRFSPSGKNRSHRHRRRAHNTLEQACRSISGHPTRVMSSTGALGVEADGVEACVSSSEDSPVFPPPVSVSSSCLLHAVSPHVCRYKMPKLVAKVRS